MTSLERIAEVRAGMAAKARARALAGVCILCGAEPADHPEVGSGGYVRPFMLPFRCPEGGEWDFLTLVDAWPGPMAGPWLPCVDDGAIVLTKESMIAALKRIKDGPSMGQTQRQHRPECTEIHCALECLGVTRG